MNGFDIAILVILFGFLLKGLLRGLLKEFCSLTGFFVGAFLAFRYHAPLAELMLESVVLPTQLAIGLAFALLFLATMVFFLALGFVLSRFIKLMFLGGFNRILGGVFGLTQGVMLLAVVMFALSLRPLPWGLDKELKRSRLTPPFVELGHAALEGSRKVLS